MVGRGRHQHNEINAVLKAIRKINSALTVEEDHNGHRWGWITCRCGDKPFTVNCTPRNPGIHAKQIRQWATRHFECKSDDQEGTS
ncbi:hypothetical protein [Nonomuraea sp. NPDC049141]|uniref:hypothetical protein n=1 Tax=unclassified Nonomuraea TaxID=2593643 RepID=UPI0033FA084F